MTRDTTDGLSRRRFVEALLTSAVWPLALSSADAATAATVVNDVSRLNPVRVAAEQQPRSTRDVGRALRTWVGPVSVGGGRFSMGGQIASPQSLHLDMRRMSGVVALEPAKRTIRVQAGMTWRDIQDVIDPYDFSVKTMQSFSNFTVGGSVSVNCHGRYVGHGPLINSVRSVQLVTATSEVLELTRSHHADLFHAVFGGYGGLGVITEVELDLDTNGRLERFVHDVPLEHYPTFFAERVRSDRRVVLHNADLTRPHFNAPRHQLGDDRQAVDRAAAPDPSGPGLHPREERHLGHHRAAGRPSPRHAGGTISPRTTPGRMAELRGQSGHALPGAPNARHVDIPAPGVLRSRRRISSVRPRHGPNSHVTTSTR